MVYEPSKEKNINRSREIVKARQLGVKIVLSIAGIGMVVSEYQKLSSIKADLFDYLGLALFLSTGILIFFWYWATDKELDMLFEWLDPGTYKPPSTIIETLLIIAFALLLIALLLTSKQLLLYSIIFFVYAVIGLPTERHLTRILSEVIGVSKAKLADEDKNDNKIAMYAGAVDVLEEYYIRRPMRLRSWIVAVFSIVALFLSVQWKIYDNYIAGVMSYCILIVNILWSEGLINYWRIVRDNKMRRYEAQLNA